MSDNYENDFKESNPGFHIIDTVYKHKRPTRDGLPIDISTFSEDMSLESVHKRMQIHQLQLEDRVYKARKSLSRKQNLVIHLKYYENCTDEQVSEILKVSRIAVTRMHQRALKKLKKVLHNGR